MTRVPVIWVLVAAVGLAACSGSTPETAVSSQSSQTSTIVLPTTVTPTTRPPTTVPTSSTAPPAPTTTPDQRPTPTGAAQLATELTEAELGIRNTTLTDGDRAAWGRRQQRLYRHLAVNEDWADQVLAGVRSEVATAVQLNWAARRELSSLVTTGTLSSTLPAWRIRAPLSIGELRAFYDEGEAETGIEWVYLAAINLVETRMGRIEGLSTAGATGPMQFLPSTWAECCVGDPTVDRDAIIGAATYLRDRGGPDDMDRALLGYNNSGYYVRAVSAYAESLRLDPDAYHGYHAWEVFFRSEPGLVRIPVGYYESEPVDAAQWIAENPDHVVE